MSNYIRKNINISDIYRLVAGHSVYSGDSILSAFTCIAEGREVSTITPTDVRKQPRWIPVSERLPEKNIAVLTYVSTGPSRTYCLAYWNDVRNGWEEWIGYDLIEKDRGYKVLAWMPLPEPYTESEE